MTNKYRGICKVCKCNVPAGSGTAKKESRFNRFWTILCSEHSENPKRISDTFYFPSTDTTLYRNKNGRCEDAPCCGCCTI